MFLQRLLKRLSFPHQIAVGEKTNFMYHLHVGLCLDSPLIYMPIVPMTPDSLDYCSIIISLEICSVNPSAVFFIFKIVLPYLGSFYSHINYKISLLISILKEKKKANCSI